MKDVILQVVMGMIGTIGFSILFNVRGKKLIVTGIGAAISWAVYLAVFDIYEDRVVSFFFATVTIGILAEILARVMKTPVIVLLVPMLFPLFPGSDLFYTTRNLVQGDREAFAYYLDLVSREAGSMAFGIILVTSVVQVIMKINSWKNIQKDRKTAVK